MDKYTAKQNIMSRGLSTDDIIESIYLATVEGVSGANQDDGIGFALSAVAVVWNIRGTVNNPYAAKATLTNRYRGKNVSYEAIRDAVYMYPDGIPEDGPLFDELVLGAATRPNRQTRTRPVRQERPIQLDDQSDSTGGNADQEDAVLLFGFIVGMIVTKGVLHFGWIASVILSMIITSLLMYVIFNIGYCKNS